MGFVKKHTGVDVAAPVKIVQQGISSIGNATGISPALTKVFQPIEKAVVQPVGQGLASFDKAVGNAIPGGWGTVGMVAASMIPGMQPLGMAGLGAINGSGVLRKGGSFNLQGAMMGGAMAYGMSSLAQYAQGAVPGTDGLTPPPTVDAAGNFVNPATGQIGSGLAGNSSGMLVDPSTLTSANVAQLNALSAPLEAGAGAGLQVAPPPSIGSQIMSGNFGDALSQAGQNISQGTSNLMTGAKEGVSNLGTNISNTFDKYTTPSTYENFAQGYGENVSRTGEGIKNLVGLGDISAKQASTLAAANATNLGLASPGGAAIATVYGGMGLADLEAQRNYLKEQQASNNISQQEYNAAMAEIDRSIAVARNAVSSSPFTSNPDRSASIGDTYYGRSGAEDTLYGKRNPNERLYAKGGEVEHYFGGGILPAISPLLDKLNISISAPAAAASPVDFRSLRSEGMPSPIPEGGGGGFGLGSIAKGVNNLFDNGYKRPDLGTTLYEKRPGNENVYDRFVNKKYAVGGSVDDELGMDEARGLSQGNLQNGFMGGGMPSYMEGGNVSTYARGGEAQERRDYLDMMEADLKSPPAQYVEGMGFVTPPPSVEGRLGANFDALGGRIRAGASGMAMMTPDKKIMAMPTMMDIGYKGRVGPGDLDVGLQRAMRSAPGRGRDYAANVNYSIPFAEGGEARFLSGGGDGMSDSIPASINDRQEARLADGEFVIPADVVSHLGNGSSKAGAKRLYSMMDKVRQARTGTKKQAPEVNPKKLMPA